MARPATGGQKRHPSLRAVQRITQDSVETRVARLGRLAWDPCTSLAACCFPLSAGFIGNNSRVTTAASLTKALWLQSFSSKARARGTAVVLAPSTVDADPGGLCVLVCVLLLFSCREERLEAVMMALHPGEPACVVRDAWGLQETRMEQDRGTC